MEEKLEVRLRGRVRKSTNYVREYKKGKYLFRVSYSPTPVKETYNLLWFELSKTPYPIYVVMFVPKDSVKIVAERNRFIATKDVLKNILEVLETLRVRDRFFDISPGVFDGESRVVEPWNWSVIDVGRPIEPYRTYDLNGLILTKVYEWDVAIPEGAVKRNVPEKAREVLGCSRAEAFVSENEAVVVCRKELFGMPVVYGYVFKKKGRK